MMEMCPHSSCLYILLFLLNNKISLFTSSKNTERIWESSRKRREENIEKEGRRRRRRKKEKKRREGPIGNEHWVSRMFHPHQQLVQN